MIIKHEDKKVRKDISDVTNYSYVNSNTNYNDTNNSNVLNIDCGSASKKIKLDNEDTSKMNIKLIDELILSPITPGPMIRDCAKKINQIDIKKFGKSVKNIGKGTYGTVDLHIEKKTGEEVVIKTCTNNHDEDCDNENCCCGAYELTEDVVREISALHALNPHPNIVSMIGVNYVQSPIKVVLEKADDTLWSYIKQKKVYGDTKLTKKVMYHIVRGIHWMNSIGIWHRDIKPQNILMMPNNRAVIADFGLARGHVFEWDNLTDLVYTIWWRPPEILMKECLDKKYLSSSNGSSAYNEKAEIWAIGMCMWDILSSNIKTAEKYLRSDDCSEELQLWKILRCFDNGRTGMEWKMGKTDTYKHLSEKSKSKDFKKSWIDMSKKNDDDCRERIEKKLGYKLKEDTWDLFQGMMNLSPNKRYNINDVLDHEYFDSVRNEIESKYPLFIREKEVCKMNTFGILPENWQTICSWLWNVIDEYEVDYNLYFLAIHIMRCYLYLKKSKESEIQLIGVASLYLSSLYMGQEENMAGFKASVVSKGILKRKSISNMEKNIFSEVGNVLHVPTSWYKCSQYLQKTQKNTEAMAEILGCVEASPLSYYMSAEDASNISINLYSVVVEKKRVVLGKVEKDILTFIKKFRQDANSEPMHTVSKKVN